MLNHFSDSWKVNTSTGYFDTEYYYRDSHVGKLYGLFRKFR